METGPNRHRFINEIEDSNNSPENSGGDSPLSSAVSTSSSKRSRRAIQKRVVSVPMKDVEGLRANRIDQMSTPPPFDSWAWRKYGQKPIKGSPYPRGYYRCSSSKGCPARKQVERSKLDPKMLLITYYCEHNHNWPVSKTSHHKTAAINVKNSILEEEEEEDDEEEEEEEEKPRNILSNQSSVEVVAPENEFSPKSNTCEAPSLIYNGEFGLFADFDSTSFAMLESPMLIEDRISSDSEMAMVLTMGEEEDLFADLGELPECSAVFRRGLVRREAEQRRPSLATTT